MAPDDRLAHWPDIHAFSAVDIFWCIIQPVTAWCKHEMLGLAPRLLVVGFSTPKKWTLGKSEIRLSKIIVSEVGRFWTKRTTIADG